MSLNPEKNIKVRALLYVIGCGGLLHLATLLILAITKKDAHYFHPLYTIDVDQLWPAARDNVLVYITGWLIFGGVIFLAYRLLRGSK